jgi:hypothetical protein
MSMLPATYTSADFEESKKLRSNVSKSLLKGTIAVAILSVFLQINPSTYLNYVIFLVLCYAMIGAYMIFKGTTQYILGDTGIAIRRPLRKEILIAYSNVGELSYAQGMLAKRFGCGSVYLALKKGKGTHTSSTGQSAFVIKDIPGPLDVYNEISRYTSPFAPTV